MLGTGTRMEAVTTDWGARGYMPLGLNQLQAKRLS